VLRGDIQGLRAIAVFGVIIFHINNKWAPGGFLGVDVFFAISGFLMTSIILVEKRSHSFKFVAFYLKRIKRIVPAYLFLLSCISLVMSMLLTENDFSHFKESLWASLTFSANYYYSTFGEYFAPSSIELPLLHLWSIAVEMQFYLLLPCLLIYVSDSRLKAILPVMIFTLLLYVGYQTFVLKEGGAMHFSFGARLPEFFIGSWVAMVSLGDKWRVGFANVMFFLGLVLIFGSLLFINEDLLTIAPFGLIACVGTMLVVASSKNKYGHLLLNPMLIWLGNISYSLYLWHWPVLASIRYYTGSYDLSLSLLFVFVFFTALGALASYYFFEQKKGGGLKGFKSVFVCSSFFVLILSCAIYANAIVVPQLPVSQTRYGDKERICHGKIVGDCFRGDTSSGRLFLLLGDSLGGQLNHFFDVVGNKSDFAIQVVTASSCVTIPGFNLKALPNWARKPCADQIKEGIAFTERAEVIFLAGAWEYHSKRVEFMDSLDIFFNKMSLQGKKVVLMSQPPIMDSDTQRMVRFNMLGLPAKATVKNRWESGNELIKAMSLKHSNVFYLDLSESKIFTTLPFYKDKLVYMDESHLNEIGSYYYGVEAVPHFKNLEGVVWE